jgi:hypothetical protein
LKTVLAPSGTRLNQGLMRMESACLLAGRPSRGEMGQLDREEDGVGLHREIWAGVVAGRPR